MAILLHGTTRSRAEKIVKDGPDPAKLGDDGFPAYLEGGPFPLEPPEKYARRKAALPECAAEGGPVILAFGVPDAILALAVDELFPLNYGLVQFDQGMGLEELRAAWSSLWKEIRSV